MIKIEGKKINLRTPRKSDAESIYRHARDREISRYTYVPHPYRLDDAYHFLKSRRRMKRKGNFEVFGIAEKETNQIIGMIGMHRIDKVNKRVEIGYWLGKKYWGQGMMTEAVNLVLKYAFKELKLQRVTARVWHPNIASAKLLEQCGFKYEGRLRRQTFRKNHWYDELLFGILKGEFSKNFKKQIGL